MTDICTGEEIYIDPPPIEICTCEGLAESKQDKLTAGDGITIDENNVISASGGGGSSLQNIADAPNNGIVANKLTNTANGNYAFAEGNSTKATGNGSHSEGIGTVASGMASHAEGSSCEATGMISHAHGWYSRAAGQYQTVIGKCNIVDNSNTYAEIVGNGSANNARSNARTLDWNGNEWLAGTIHPVGGILLTAPNNTVYKVTVDNSGQLVVTAQ